MLVDSLTKLNESSRKAISFALVLIAAIAMYSWIVAPHVEHLFAVQRYEPVVSNVASENTAINEAVQTRRKKLDELRQEFARFRAILFTQEEGKEFLTGLQAISEKAGCLVRSLNFSTRQPKSGSGQAEGSSIVVAKSATLNVIGGYDSIIKLIQKLQDRTQKVWIDSFSMELYDADSGQLTCDMTITIYAIREKETVIDE